jgi:hypothetical protein
MLRLEVAMDSLTARRAHVSEVMRLVGNNEIRLNSLKRVFAGYDLELAVSQNLNVGVDGKVAAVLLIVPPELSFARCGEKNQRALSLHAHSD